MKASWEEEVIGTKMYSVVRRLKGVKMVLSNLIERGSLIFI